MASNELTPPPTKKLKQATLSFKVLTPKAIPQTQNTKKRKISDASDPKITKAAKSENKNRIVRKEDEENEVSSSSEADSGTKVLGDNADKSSKSVGLLDKFVKTTPRPANQQEEVSTSCKDEVVIVLEDDLSDNACDATDSQDTPQDEQKQENTEEASAKVEDKSVSKKVTECHVEGDAIVIDEEEKSDKKEEAEEEPSPNSKSEIVDEKSQSSNDSDDKSDTAADDANTDSKGDNVKEASKPCNPEGKSTVTPDNTAKPKAKTPGSLKRDIEKKKKLEEKEQQRKAKELEKQKQKEEKEREKEKQRLEKERLKAEKDKEKQQKKEEKEKERLQKEKEKKEKQEELQKKKEEKLKQKEDEKKKREEAMALKNEEKEKKEKERKQKEEEKKRQEEEEIQKKQKAKQQFQSFFSKSAKPAAAPKPISDDSIFQGFEVKENMCLAPRNRVEEERRQNMKQSIEEYIEEQVEGKSYLSDLKNKVIIPSSTTKTWKVEMDDVLLIDEDSNDKKKKQYTVRAKLLQFHENNRPAFYGTWRKKSKHLCARNPFKQDKALFDYECDSDDEWEEEEPGESLSHSEGEQEGDGEKNEDDDDDDQFFVPHGYLSEGEGAEDEEEDVSPDILKARQVAKARAWEQEMNNKKCEVLKPRVFGCCWWVPEEMVDDPAKEILCNYQAEFLLPDPVFPLATYSPKSNADTTKKSEKKEKKKADKKKLIQPVPEEAIPDLIRLVHGNAAGILKLLKEFKEFWRRKILGPAAAMLSENQPDSRPATPCVPGDENSPEPSPGDQEEVKCYTISKRQLDMKIKSIATYEKRENCKKTSWFVNDELLEKYQMKDLPVPTEWVWVTKPPTKTPKSTPTTTEKNEEIKENPSKSLPKKVCKITQFAKPGVSPHVPQKIKKSTPGSGKHKKASETSFEIGPAPDTPKSVSVSTPKALAKFFKKANMSDSVICLDTTVEDSDCMIVDSPDMKPLPKVAGKGQPTLLKMFSKAKPSSALMAALQGKPAVEKLEADSTETPMLVE